MKLDRTAAVVSIGSVLLLAGCSDSSSPSKTAPSPRPATATATATANATPRSTEPAGLDEAALSQYTAWNDKFLVLAKAFSDDMATSSFTAAAGHLDELAALAVAGKKLPATGNAESDAQWQGAMADLSAFAVLAGQGVRTKDGDKLMDSLDLLSNVQDHVMAFVSAQTG